MLYWRYGKGRRSNMEYGVSGTPSSGYTVSKNEGWGRVDSGYPTFWGTKVAEGFATADEAYAWAKWYAKQGEEEQ